MSERQITEIGKSETHNVEKQGQIDRKKEARFMVKGGEKKKLIFVFI